MKIGILGGAGRAGAFIYQEAQARGHEPVAIVRNEAKAKAKLGDEAHLLVKDTFDLTAADLVPFDAIVDALSVPWGSGKGYLHLDMATHIMHLLRDTQAIALFIIGSSSLEINGQVIYHTFDATTAQQPWFDGARYQYFEYIYLQMNPEVNWIAVSPAMAFPTGPKTGYLRGKDELLVDEAGNSQISTGNMAAAILDELEQPSAIHSRFTVRDK
ncbi:NAD(P)H-binding protein [Agrilactobacillus fermenti]|uniref:NAD(P)H-binding protein n=1 Tax=Agrilactobacillus fermenti TaxID=2586909 RepID=UPI001E44811D|nr:NAD(P)H-binding protein [Agrilactobacillus fermenti]MCD2257193.1 NAD(P)H-binding protein [Agrilactobacillus fermenti]